MDLIKNWNKEAARLITKNKELIPKEDFDRLIWLCEQVNKRVNPVKYCHNGNKLIKIEESIHDA